MIIYNNKYIIISMKEVIKAGGFLIGCVASTYGIIYAQFKYTAFKHKIFQNYNNNIK
jgi:hypothetical protein